MRIVGNLVGRRLLVAVSLAFVPLAAHAQASLTYFARPSINPYGVAPLEIYSQDRDVLQLYTGLEVTRHSNVFALPSGVSPQPVYGKSSRSETIVRALAGVSFDRQVSLQRFRLDASVLPVKMLEYSRFDHVGYSAGGHWDWAIGRPYFGTLGARFTRAQTPFGNYYINRDNIERRAMLYASGGVRLTPDLAAFVGLDAETLDNSFSGVRSADYRFISAETGLRFARGDATSIDLVLRHTDGDYPNRQVTDSLGNLLPGAVDNAFKQNALLARLQVRPSNDSQMGGHIGYTRRSFDRVSQRDFSGVTGGLNIEWRPTGLFTMYAELVRDIQSEELLTASYVDLTTLRLRPSYQFTGKIRMYGLAEIGRASYEGDPGVAATATRKDDLRAFGVGLSYEYARNISVNLEARRNQRDSNVASVEYSDNILSANILARF
jgi:exopolysaccharide biosynthesis operon protein EpsL